LPRRQGPQAALREEDGGPVGDCCFCLPTARTNRKVLSLKDGVTSRGR
jgi:hypothetical protein